MIRTGIQLYTLRELEDGLPTLLRRVGETDFDGVEFAGFGETSPDEAATVLEEVGLEAAAAHIGIDALEDDPGGAAETCAALDCDRVVVPYLDDSYFENAAAVRETATRLSTLAGRLADRGLALGYHNHDHEFVALEGDERSAFELLIDETDDALSIELDVGWANAAGYGPVALLERLEGRVPLVHIKDVADGQPVELGDGEVDIDACAAAARDAGTEWLIYEHDEPVDPAASLENGARTLARLRD
ncbi:sugar phosphate isomerase/epimerase [Natrinema sp. 1APR25-10V2]|uniref:sugar phosphate isomerase/epimerase family protein n=1 Tax=Natrinema sp. 1APR25-10V2 TaxID=2951081 RepID=UPI0028746FC4|nr:sugar phosphate isomerase/epimerase [Natrinema sp. 1APR25-10V2]MDS0474563.1 sugar phosphate isomerase/epimerase [Natrinema sp. 1APR25-10V2]